MGGTGLKGFEGGLARRRIRILSLPNGTAGGSLPHASGSVTNLSPGDFHINSELAFERQADQVVYYNGHLPVFTHGASDLASFRLFATQLIINGTASYAQIAKAFGVPARTLKRCAQRYRLRGAEAFFKPAAKRNGHRLTPE